MQKMKLYILIAGVFVLLATIIFFSRTAPLPPFLLSPTDGATLGADSGTPPYEFVWRHGGLMLRYPIILRRANHFVVCLKEYQADDFACVYPDPVPRNGPPWARAAADIPSTTNAIGAQIENPIRTYTFTVDNLPSSYLDKDLMWTAGACASQSSTSCSYAIPPHRFKILGRNLVGLDIHQVPVGGSNVSLTFDFENSGPNETGPFQFKWHVVQMMPDISNNPRRDVNSSDIDPSTDRVMRISTGEVVPIDSLPMVAGVIDNSDVWGILLRDGVEVSNVESHNGLDPGAADTFIKTVDISGPTVIPNAAVSIAMALIMDPSNAMQEIDEFDNVHVSEEDYTFEE